MTEAEVKGSGPKPDSFPAFSRHSINVLPFSVSITSVCGGAERVFSVLRNPSSLSSLTYSWTVFHLRSSSLAIWDMGLGPAFTDLSIASTRLSVSTILPKAVPPLSYGCSVCVNLLTHFEKHLPASVSLILDRRGIPSTVRVTRPTSWSALTIMRTVVGLMDRFCEMSVMLQSGLSSIYFRILKILFSVMDICRGTQGTISKLRSFLSNIVDGKLAKNLNSLQLIVNW